jgi:mannose-6-phosphate isomerase-like protein (cupin superfamily)
MLYAAMRESVRTPQHVWFFDTRVAVLISCSDGADRISLLEHWARHGDSPPLHVHRNEDEVFHILEGRLRFIVGGREMRVGTGQSLLASKGIPHTYRVESADGAHWLTVTRGEDFERFVRAMGRPAERDGLPPRSAPPTAAQAETLAAACLEYGIEVVGPPLG